MYWRVHGNESKVKLTGLAAANAEGDKLPVFVNFRDQTITPEVLRQPRYLEPPLSRTIFRCPWKFEIAGFYCTDKCSCSSTFHLTHYMLSSLFSLSDPYHRTSLWKKHLKLKMMAVKMKVLKRWGCGRHTQKCYLKPPHVQIPLFCHLTFTTSTEFTEHWWGHHHNCYHGNDDDNRQI